MKKCWRPEGMSDKLWRRCLEKVSPGTPRIKKSHAMVAKQKQAEPLPGVGQDRGVCVNVEV